LIEFDKVTLDGSSSTDTDGTIVSYKWTQTTGPMVWSTSMTTVVSPMFIAPEVDGQEMLTFMLAVVDNSNDTDTDEVIITVNDKDDPPNNENAPPTADAGDENLIK